jgi:hypothetical protein
MNWQKAIDKINIEKFRIPAGWDTKEKIAEELQCSPDRVHDLLKVGLASGAFESQEFPVWDAKRRMTIRTRCYRQKTDRNNEVKESGTTSVNEAIRERIVKAIETFPNENNYAISRRFHRVKASQVAAVRATL